MEAEEERGAGTRERTRVGCHLASPAIDRLLPREGASGAQIKGPEEHPDSAEQTTCKKCGEWVIMKCEHFGVSVPHMSAFCSPYAWEPFPANAPNRLALGSSIC